MDTISDTTEIIAIGLGSNLGDRPAVLQAAVARLTPYLTITATSQIYETPAAYVTDQPAFLNMAVTGTTNLSPRALLWSLKQIEHQLGRQPTFRYGPRLIDLDILFYGDRILQESELTLPHPRIAERSFVLRPLADIAPDWQHPTSRLTVAAMLRKLPAT